MQASRMDNLSFGGANVSLRRTVYKYIVSVFRGEGGYCGLTPYHLIDRQCLAKQLAGISADSAIVNPPGSYYRASQPEEHSAKKLQVILKVTYDSSVFLSCRICISFSCQPLRTAQFGLTIYTRRCTWSSFQLPTLSALPYRNFESLNAVPLGVITGAITLL